MRTNIPTTPASSSCVSTSSVPATVTGAGSPRRAARLLVGVTFGALPLLAVACGSDDATGAAAAPPASASSAAVLSADEFRAQGNELCSASNERIFGIIGQTFGSGAEPTPAQLQTALDGILAESRSLTDGIDALAAPPELVPQVDELVADLRAVADEAEAQGGPAYFATDDDPWAPAGAKADALGLTACSSDE